MPDSEWKVGMLGIAQGTSLLGAGDKISVTPTGGNSLEATDRGLRECPGVRNTTCSSSLQMPNGTADRTQRGGAGGGHGGWEKRELGGSSTR